MRKFFKAWAGVLGLAALLSFGFGGSADAAAVPQVTVVENTVAGGMDAVGELSGTITVAPFTVLHIFHNGTYTAEARFELQREITPGAGAFRKVLRLDSATADAAAHTTWTNGPNSASYRVLMTVAPTTGDVLVNVSNASTTPNEFTDWRLYHRQFTDWDTETDTVDAQIFATFLEAAGTDAGVSAAVEEGAVILITDTGSDGQDAVCLTSITVTSKAGLVSDGWMSFDTRLRANETGTDIEMGMGFVDVICDGDSGDIPYTGATNALTVVGYSNTAVIMQDGALSSAPASVTGFTPATSNAGTEGNSTGTANTTGLFYDTGADGEDDTYLNLRIEIDASGDAMFYSNGLLVFVEPSAVATTATLVPIIWVNSEDGGTKTNTLTVDWWEFYITRPSDAT